MGRALWFSLALTLLLGVVQIVSAISFDSLALVADAIHNLSDAVAVGLAVGAAWLAGLPATNTRTFGYRRAEILAAHPDASLEIVELDLGSLASVDAAAKAGGGNRRSLNRASSK